MKWSFPTQQPVNQEKINDLFMDMKIGSKQINRQAQKSEKQSVQYMKNAKDQLRKNNEQGAKLYLQNAASKNTEATNLQRMGLKQQMMAGQLKTMQTNQQLMKNFNKMGQIASLMNPNFEQMANTMSQFEESQTKMTINQKMMEELMNQQTLSSDTMADQMLNALKQQVAMEQKIKIQQAAQIKQRERKIQELTKRNKNLQS